MLDPANYLIKCLPQKKWEETEEEYKKRMALFFKENRDKFTREQIREWEKSQTLSFTLPRDEKAFEAFMRSHPETQLIMSCRNEEGMRQGMRYLNSLGYLNNLQTVKLTEDNLTYQGANLGDKKKDLQQYLNRLKLKPPGTV